MQVRRDQSHGFSLIEVLIALVVLAVGILGVAGLQANSLRNTYSATLRTQATSIAQDMVERIRANRDFALSDAENYQITTDAEAAVPDTDCRTNVCTANELAAFDRNTWLSAITTLPSGKGSVAVNPGNRSVTITVMWDNDRSGATGTNCSNDYRQDLTCFILTVNP